MSQPVAYTPPDYVPPEVADQNWSGVERRSRHPIDQLGRSLNRLCLEASSPYEIVAHLEALGLNSPTALARFGVTSHFELAHALYERTPRIRERREPKRKTKRDWATPAAMGMAFVITFLLGAFSQVEMLAPAIVVLVWSQVGSALLMKARGELPRADQTGVLGLVVQLGLLALAVAWLPLQFGLATLAPTLIWFSVGSLLWAERYMAAMFVPALVGTSLAAAAAFSLSAALPQSVAVVAAAVFCVPFTLHDPRKSLGWLRRSLAVVPHPLLYGVGQGMLILALLADSSPDRNVIPGALLLLVIILLSQRLLISLKTLLTSRLWRARSRVGFRHFAQMALLGYVGLFLVPLAVAMILEATLGPAAWHFHWYAFGLFGASLGIAVVEFALGNPAGASIPFAVAGSAAWAGLPFLWVGVALAAALLLVAQLRVRQVGRYAIYLL